MTTPPDAEAIRRVTVTVAGNVQGVGFRWWTRSRALELGLRGWAMNKDDGRVEIVAEGLAADLETLVRLLAPSNTSPQDVPPRPGRVDSAVASWSAAKHLPSGFRER